MKKHNEVITADERMATQVFVEKEAKGKTEKRYCGVS
jgi:hypothetical protein